MSNYNSLKTTIDANIKQNGRQEITGQILNSVLNQMVTTLGAGYQFAGVATTATNPGTPDAKVFYIANGKGTYTNFGGLEVTEDEVVVLYWDSSWHKVSTGIASADKLNQLGQQVIYDVTANNADAKFASLSALLSNENLSTLIPVSVRCGGMSIRFVQTSDNKYVQYRFVLSTFTTAQFSSIYYWQRNDSNDFFNLNYYYNKSDAYINASTARNAVPQVLRTLGMKITYYLSDGWHTEQFIGYSIYRWEEEKAWCDISNIIGQQQIEITQFGYYIRTGSIAIGNTVDLTPVGTPAALYFSYSILDCQEGDTFIISGTGGQNPRLWAFIDSDNKLLSVSLYDITLERERITAPTNASKLIINSCTNKKCYKVLPNSMSSEIDGLSNINKTDITTDIDISSLSVNGFFASANAWNIPTGTHLVMPVGYAKKIRITANSSYAGFAVFFKRYIKPDSVSNYRPDLLCNYTGDVRQQVAAISETGELDIPNDCSFVVIPASAGQYGDYTPARIQLVYNSIEDRLLSFGNDITELKLDGNNRTIKSFIPDDINVIQNRPIIFYNQNCFDIHNNDDSVNIFAAYPYFSDKGTYITGASDTLNTMQLNLRNFNGVLTPIKKININVFVPTAPSNDWFILPIGDSLMYGSGSAHRGVINNELSRLFNGIGGEVPNGAYPIGFSNVHVIGTMEDDATSPYPVKYEGRAGWKCSDYLTKSSYGGESNAFWNPNANKFDLNYYLDHNGFYTDGVESDGSNLIIPIMLNWNSIYHESLESFIDNYKLLIEAIHSTHAAATILVVGVNCPPYPLRRSIVSVSDMFFDQSIIKSKLIDYENALKSIAALYNYVHHIPLLPLFGIDGTYPTAHSPYNTLNIRSGITDTFYSDFVHPNDAGYGEIADILFNNICYLFFNP